MTARRTLSLVLAEALLALCTAAAATAGDGGFLVAQARRGRDATSSDSVWTPGVYGFDPAQGTTQTTKDTTPPPTVPPVVEEEGILLIPIAVVAAGGEEVTSLQFPDMQYGLNARWLNTRWLDRAGVPYKVEVVQRTVYYCPVVGASVACTQVSRATVAPRITKANLQAAIAAVNPYSYADIWGQYDGGWTVLPPGDNSPFVSALRDAMGAGATYPSRRVGVHARQWCPNSNCIALALPK